MANKTAKGSFPTVLSFEKKLVPSDGFFYGTTWQERDHIARPLYLIEKSVRGTVSNRLQSVSKLSAQIDQPNLQRIDCCSLSENQDTLKLSFSLKVLGGIDRPCSCNNEEFIATFRQRIDDYTQRTNFMDLAKRYAMNIANGRFFWRNRIGAKNIEVVVKTDTNEKFTFNAFDIPLNVEKDCQNGELSKLTDSIAKALRGERKYLLLNIDGYAQVGKAQEVYPSQELVLDKNNEKSNKKSKVLFSVDSIAAMHSQNALRTIDTWYPKFGEEQFAIAVEPYGTVTNMGIVYRPPAGADSKDFYSLFENYIQKNDLSPQEENYVIAVLIRGGVFGKSKDD